MEPRLPGNGAFLLWRVMAPCGVPSVIDKAISNKPRADAKSRLFIGLFFALFAVIGLAATYVFAGRPIVRILRARGWESTSCFILYSGVRTSRGSDNDTYRVEVRYRYDVDGVRHFGDLYQFNTTATSNYASKARAVEGLRTGTQLPCYFDPAHPESSVIDRGFTMDLWFGTFPLVFFIVGAGGLYFAFVRRGAGVIRMPDSSPSAGVTFASARRAPGVLKQRQTRRTKFIFFGLFALAWNGFITFFAMRVLHSFSSGVFQWGVALFLVPFVLAGIVLIAVAVAQGLQLANPRPVLSVDSEVVALGDELGVDWMIEGSVEKLSRLSIALEGREEATYRRGTSTHTDRRVFASIPVIDQPAPVAPQGRQKLRVPADTMHSFDASNNKIVWSLRVRSEIPKWPDSDDEFALTVAPRRR